MLFFPDQHLGRNTALGMGIPLDQMPLWDPHADSLGGNTEEQLRQSKVILWKGHCSVHQMFRPEHVRAVPREAPGHQDSGPSRMPAGSVRPGRRVRLDGQDHHRRSKRPPPGTKWAIGTELHLVNRLKQEHPEQEIHFLSPVVCMCATMYRIDLAHLCWSLENLAAGTPVNVIEVDEETARWSLVALERMLEVK